MLGAIPLFIGALIVLVITILCIHDLCKDLQRAEAERDRYRDMWDKAIERAQRAEAVVSRCKNAIADSYELEDKSEPPRKSITKELGNGS